MVISSTDKDVNDVNNDVGQALSAGDDGTNGDIAM